MLLWTVLAALCVIGTRIVTSYRLRDLKIKLKSTMPKVDKLRQETAAVQDENEAHKATLENMQTRLSHLKDVINGLESAIRKPSAGTEADERMQVLNEVEDVS